MNTKSTLFTLFGIVILAIVLRFWGLGAIPEGFQIDEAAFGYNAYSLLKTGADEYGVPHPLTLRSYNDYKAALYAYVDIPFIAILGLNEYSVRLPSAILGVLFVLVAYGITYLLTKKNSVSLIVSLLCCISPTLIFQTRIQSDPILSVFLVLLGVFFFLFWTTRKNTLILLLSFVFFIASLAAYQAPRIFLLLFLPLLFWHYKSHITKKIGIIMIIFTVCFMLLNGYLILTADARYNQTSVFDDPGVQLVLNEAIREDGQTSPFVTRIFHNKVISYSRAILDNYFSYFSFDFLFYQTESPVRETVPDTGFLYLIELPFLLIGVYKIIRKKISWGYFILGWLVITPATLSFFTQETPNIHRFLLAILPFEIVIAFGIVEFLNIFRKNLLLYRTSTSIIVLIFAYSLSYFLHELFVHQPIYRPWNRNFADKALIQEIDTERPHYKKIIVSTSQSNTYMFYLFYNNYDPKKYQLSGSQGNNPGGHLDNLVFTPLVCPLSAGRNGEGKIIAEQNVLYVDDGTCVTPKHDIHLVATIRWRDNSTAFKLIQYTPQNS